eukprot:Skav203171  [mRNA]  locus=scaffold371:338983:341096:+ [translate_table: standard]
MPRASTVPVQVQRKAESEQSYVEQQKRLNVKLQADRPLKLSNQRKAVEEDLRKVGSELRSKASAAVVPTGNPLVIPG